MTLADTYQKKTDLEHILDAPDTYIGSIEKDFDTGWIFTNDGNIVHKKYKWVPGLFKIFDEGAVNMRDHFVRLMQKKKEKNIIPVSLFDFTINKETGIITMINDGNGIDIEKHPEYKIWIPEMIFAHLRTSTNYKKEEKKIVGGKNGFGVKLIMIYSLWAKIETVDHIRGKKFSQEYKNNLTTICKPKIRKTSSKPYTKLSFLPDYKRFGIDNLTDDIFNLLKRRIYDLAAITSKSVKVKLNSHIIPVKSFDQYIDMYIGKKSETKRVFETISNRWEIGVCLSPLDEFTHVSFVNGINTKKGGKHIEYILNQITKKIIIYIEKKRKVRVKPSTIKEQIMLFVNCVIENPTFDSQTKEYMTTPYSKFGSTCALSDKFIDKIAKLGIIENAIQLNELKENKSAKKTDGRRTKFVRGLPKLIDANFAGTSRGKECIIILCEGDSAKAGIVSGLSKEDRDKIGVFPLKGKLLNTKDTSMVKINNNDEINAIKKILGLEVNKKYTDRKEIEKKLRYGKILFMTDQDLDGAHIKGLGINLFDSQWPELIEVNDFIGFMNTPIIKITHGKKVISFYNETDYNTWKENNDIKGWKVKYYKGLGTSTAKEFKEYFKEKKIIHFNYEDISCRKSLDLVFNKKRADDRKKWLGNYDKTKSLDTTQLTINYSDFVNREMIHYSKYDCERSISNLIDGLKPSTRKILFSAFKRKLTKEIKVAQLAGYTSEHSAYHHGEASLQKAIVGMAQEFVGSNNIALLMPNGQFGTRLRGGKDSASERYIFTQLNPLTKYIFPETDMPILTYLDDDGTSVEPDFYVPIIPTLLVNGGKGIGTGFSFEILNYNPLKIVKYLKKKIKKESVSRLTPYYEGFKGTIHSINNGKKYLFKGKYQILQGNRLHITELPIGIWTDTYKEFLETLMDSKKKQLITEYKDMSNSVSVDIMITLARGVLASLISKKVDYNCTALEKTFKLYTTRTTTNMHVFNHKQQMKKFENVEDIIDAYYPIRYNLYTKRKAYLIKELENIVNVLHNKARFIEEQCNDIIDLRKKKQEIVNELLEERNYNKVNDKFNYLTKMPLDSLIEENIIKLRNERDNKKDILEKIKKTTEEEMWLSELTLFKTEYKKYIKGRNNRNKS